MQDKFPIALTFDIDWAPDFAIEECINLLLQASIPATFFATHPSPILKEISNEKNFEIGIHPNFYANSSHGKTEYDIMNYVLDIVPEAKSMRTHGLFQSTNLFFLILEKFKQIDYDFSIFLPNNKSCLPYIFNDENFNTILRVPFQWEDDLFFLHAPENRVIENILYAHATYQIFDFHPIHIYLNSYSTHQYNLLKSEITTPLNQIKKEQASCFVNKTIGAKDWLISIINTIEKDRFSLCSDIYYRILM